MFRGGVAKILCDILKDHSALSFRVKQSKETHPGLLNPNDDGTVILQNLTNYLPMTQNSIPEGLNHQQYHGENLKYCTIHIHCCAALLLLKNWENTGHLKTIL
jgi:hypothetical protein